MRQTLKITFLDKDKGWVEDTLEVDTEVNVDYNLARQDKQKQP